MFGMKPFQSKRRTDKEKDSIERIAGAALRMN